VAPRSPNLPQLSHFATLFPPLLSFGTGWERIAAESLTPPGVPFRSPQHVAGLVLVVH